MKKYVFKPYNKIFPELFEREKKRILSHMKKDLVIEHVGSTSIPYLGGKGIIDIAIAINKEEMDLTSKKLQELGYLFKPNFSTQERFYFNCDLPDPEEDLRRYHIHLTYPESQEWKELIFFRDYLRNHPDERKIYEELKERAVIDSNEEGEKYRMLKEPMIKNILNRNSSKF